ncbi:hypothetical protein [Yoonia sp.]|uniref:hypothetical protein n=1 Tax=Yoonia sp. TaxID=2212373 RepID=UPI00391B92E2
MKHPLDHARTSSDSRLSRVIAMEKDTLPRPASLDLQQRPRDKAPGKRAAEFLRIARQKTA